MIFIYKIETMILRESEKSKIREMHREYSVIKENKNFNLPEVTLNWVKKNIVSQSDFDKFNNGFSLMGKSLMKEISKLDSTISKDIKEYFDSKKIDSSKSPKGGLEISSNIKGLFN